MTLIELWIIRIIVACFLIKIVFYVGIVAATTFWMNYNKKCKITNGKENSESSHSETEESEHCESKFNFKRVIASGLDGATKYLIEKTSMIPSHTIRCFIYKYVFLIETDDKVVVYKGTIFRHGYNISIGKGSIIGDNNILDGRGGLKIGENCNLSSEVHIWTAQHDVNGEYFEFVSRPVVIEDRCWISSNTTILPGVTIHEGAVVASGSVVTKDAEPYAIYAGIPAKKIGERNRSLQYEFLGMHDWFY